MRRALAPVLGIAAAGLLLAPGFGCTFLISFDERASNDAGTLVDSAVVPPTSASSPDSAPPLSDSGADARDVPVTPACDTTFPLGDVKGCASFVEGGQICADNPGLTTYPGDRTKDVVTCSKTGATCVRHCVACSHLPQGFPDQCDQCVGKADGKYCGTDMGWQPENFRLLVTCASERMAVATPCSTKGCDSKGGMGAAVCRP